MTTYAKSPSSSSASSSSSPKKSAFAKLCRKLSPKRRGRRMPSLDQVEVEGDDKVVESQQQQLRMVFNYMDEDGDGKISPAELRNCVGAFKISAEEAEAAVACSDRDGDGHLGFEEFCSLMDTSHEKEEEKVKELREAFMMYTNAMEECITPGSLRTMLGRLGESRSLDDCKAIIRVFDLNGDGVLTFDEFALMMAN